MARYGHNHKGGRPAGLGLSSQIARIVRDKTEEMISALLSHEAVKQKLIKERAENVFHSGWLYIIKDNLTGLYKIGMTTSKTPANRFSHYKAHNMDIDVIYVGKHDFIDGLETETLACVPKANKIKGDWFICDMDILCDILRIITSKSVKKSAKWTAEETIEER